MMGAIPFLKINGPLIKTPRKTSYTPGAIPTSLSSCYHALHTLTAGLEFGGIADKQLLHCGCLYFFLLLLRLMCEGDEVKKGWVAPLCWGLRGHPVWPGHLGVWSGCLLV